MDGGTVELKLIADWGGRMTVVLGVNQLDDATLQTIVPYMERVAKAGPGVPIYPEPVSRVGRREYQPVQLWHERSIDALQESRTVPLDGILRDARNASLRSAVFIGTSAETTCIMDSAAQLAYGEQTYVELTVTSWGQNSSAAGWGGQAARDWGRINAEAVANHAVTIATRSAQVSAVEPGKYTAILESSAVAQFVRWMPGAFDAYSTLSTEATPFSVSPHSSRVGRQVFDPRITIRSDPDDPDGGFYPFSSNGYPVGPITWVSDGVLRNLAYAPEFGAMMGKSPYSDPPFSFRLGGGLATIDEMIANCKRGIYVNRFFDVELRDAKSGVVSGVTHDGCFLVRDGKIDRAIKNFRFLESPWFAFNKLDMIGVPRAAALGYTPGAQSWPLPMIVAPPVMVRDFNFVGFADAV